MKTLSLPGPGWQLTPFKGLSRKYFICVWWTDDSLFHREGQYLCKVVGIERNPWSIPFVSDLEKGILHLHMLMFLEQKELISLKHGSPSRRPRYISFQFGENHKYSTNFQAHKCWIVGWWKSENQRHWEVEAEVQMWVICKHLETAGLESNSLLRF